MFKNKTELITFAIMMVIVMVYGMVVYNIALAQGGLNNQIFLITLYELSIMGIIAFILEELFVEKLATKITFKTLDGKNTQPIFITIFMSCMIVCLMCPLMSLVATLIHHNDGMNMIIHGFK